MPGERPAPRMTRAPVCRASEDISAAPSQNASRRAVSVYASPRAIGNPRQVKLSLRHAGHHRPGTIDGRSDRGGIVHVDPPGATAVTKLATERGGSLLITTGNDDSTRKVSIALVGAGLLGLARRSHPGEAAPS